MSSPLSLLLSRLDKLVVGGGRTTARDLAGKLRALLQRNKGRDLVDLSHALEVFKDLNVPRLVEIFGQYLALSNQAISRAQAEQRMIEKFEQPDFLADVRPLLAAHEAEKFSEEASKKAFAAVFRDVIRRIPGDPWALRKSDLNEPT